MLTAMDDAQLARRFGTIERQLTLISQQLGIDCPPFVGDGPATDATEPAEARQADAPAPTAPSGLTTEVVDLARAGHTTQAISRLCHLTGASLIEAKRAVDAL
jgi:ribosomal protein L7/L12